MFNLQEDSITEGSPIVSQSYENPTMRVNNSKLKGLTYVFFGWVCVVLSVLITPILFGSIAFFMSLMTFLERSRVHGALMLFFAIIGTLLGTLLSFFVTGTMFV